MYMDFRWAFFEIDENRVSWNRDRSIPQTRPCAWGGGQLDYRRGASSPPKWTKSRIRSAGFQVGLLRNRRKSRKLKLGFHIATLVIYKLSSSKFITHNDLYQQYWSNRVVILIEIKLVNNKCLQMSLELTANSAMCLGRGSWTMTWLRVEGLGFRVQGSRLRVEGWGLRVEGWGLSV